MKFKKSLLVFCVIICILFMVSTAAAGDVNDTTIASEDSSDMLNQVKEVLPVGSENEQVIGDVSDSSQLGVTDDSASDDMSDEISKQSMNILESTESDITGSSLNQTALSSSKSYDVSTVNQLKSALSSNKYDKVTINLKSNIKTGKNFIDLSPSIKALTINGNGKTIEGDGYSFLKIENDATVTIKNIRIINFEASYGAVIYNWGGGKLTVVNSVFENNNVLRSGGVIYNSGDNSIIKGCTFKNNMACKDLDSTGVDIFGGAIFNSGDDVTITGCTFENNVAKTYGSGLYYDDKQIFGGAIYNSGDNVKITKNFFKKNLADEGSAIYTSGSNVLIDSNTFKLNKALSSRKDDAIVYMLRGGYFIEVDNSDNTFVTDTKCYSTIFNRFGSIVATNNKFDDRLDTVIKAPSAVTYGNYLVITLKDNNGKVVSGVKVTVKIKTSKTLKTNKNGQIKISTKNLVPKSYAVKITFKGSSKYAPSSKSVKVTVKKATPKLAAKSKTFKKAKKVKKYTIKLKTNKNKAIKKVKVTLKIKGKKAITAKTNNKGVATVIVKLTKKGTFKSTVTYKGNKYYNKVTKKVNIKIK